MLPSAGAFVVHHSFRLPGLGLLVLPVLPAPAWLASPGLHTALMLQLHRHGLEAILLLATVEELTPTDGLPTRALLLEADPGGSLPPGSWLVPEPIGY
jgi:hypothetical protein